MTCYPVGTSAEKIIGVIISRTGVITRVQRQRNADIHFVDGASAEPAQMQSDSPVEFVVQVARDDSGILEIAPEGARQVKACTIIPLGPERPFLASELPPRPGSNGVHSIGREMRFQFSHATLTWTSFNLSGRIELGEGVRVVSILLRLPAGQDGDLIFSTSPPS